MALFESLNFKPTRLGPIDGHLGKRNEVVYHLPKCESPEAYVVFFGGDVQDYKENMLKHRDNKYHVKWDLESTCSLLHDHFPKDIILIIKPLKMSLMSFSCFENFAEVNNFGAPTYSLDVEPLKHLQALLFNTQELLKCQLNPAGKQSLKEDMPIKLIGFSKGSVVLNQFLYSFLALKEHPDENISLFISRITDMYWLEGGHSGSSETWVTNKSVLENFASMKKIVHINVTPYQVFCDTRPRIGKEERIFRETLLRFGCIVKRTLHFEDEPRSLENHFQILKVFQ